MIWSRLRTLSQDTVEVCPTLSGGGRMRQIQQLRGAWRLCQFPRLYRGRLRLDQKAGQLWKSLDTVCRSRPKWLSSDKQSDGGVQVQRGAVKEKGIFFLICFWHVKLFLGSHGGQCPELWISKFMSTPVSSVQSSFILWIFYVCLPAFCKSSLDYL